MLNLRETQTTSFLRRMSHALLEVNTNNGGKDGKKRKKAIWKLEPVLLLVTCLD